MKTVRPSRPKLGQPCPCGSGKKYKDCCALKEQGRKKALRRSKTLAKWAGAIVLLGLIVYGISQMSGVAYTDADIRVVDFSTLDERQRKSALQSANQARCVCGCGMSLAQCVATDSTCPLRDGNIERIGAMVKAANSREPGL